MNALLDSDWLPVLGEALLHSLWQGVVLWSLLIAIIAWNRKLSPRTLHYLALAMLTLLAFSPAATSVVALVKIEKPREIAIPQVIRPVDSKVELGEQVTESKVIGPAEDVEYQSSSKTKDHSAVINAYHSNKDTWFKGFALIWMSGVIVMLLQRIAGWSWLEQFRQTVFIPDERMHSLMVKCANMSGVRQIAIWMTERVGIPLVVGIVRPAVYFPARLLARLDDREIEALLLHEFAHLRRHDARWQAWITVAEMLLFFNPAVWAIGRKARQAAELACDDLVVQWQGDRKSYAQALLSVEEWRGEGLVLAASGAGGGLVSRVRRILGQADQASLSSRSQRFGWLAIALMAIFLTVCGWGVPKLVRALTDEERVALIADKENKVGLGEAIQPRELIAKGRVRAADGSKLPENGSIGAYSQSNSLIEMVNFHQDIKLETKGQSMTIFAWVEGFAPNWINIPKDEFVDGVANFDLVVERGFPGVIHLTGNGQGISGAKLTYSVNTSDSSGSRSIVHAVTEPDGTAIIGNVKESTRIKLDVLAHGYQWFQWDAVGFHEKGMTELVLKDAVPVIGTIIDASSGKSVEGAKVYCTGRHPQDGDNSHHFGGTAMPLMSMASSDKNGRILLDVCRERELYDIHVTAPGYAETIVRGIGDKGNFEVKLQPELRISGWFKRGQGDNRIKKWSTWMNFSWSDINLSTEGIKLEERDEQLRFDVGGLPSGKGEIELSGLIWKFDLKESIKDIILVPYKGRWIPEGTDGKQIVQKRMVEAQFLSADGASLYNGNITISSRRRTEFANVQNGRIQVEVELPGFIEFSPLGMTGYTFISETVRVDESGELLIVQIPLVPAGAIEGRIIVDESVARSNEQTFASLQLIDQILGANNKPWFPESHGRHGSTVTVLNDGRGYFASGLPLGFRYRIRLYKGMTLIESDEMRLTKERPLQNGDLILPVGEMINGQVEDYTGAEVSLKYVSSNSTQSWKVKTTENGQFTLNGINFNVKGAHYVSIKGSPGYAPSWVKLSSWSKNVKLKRERGEIQEGRLVDSLNKPVKGVKLRFFHYAEQGETNPDFMRIIDPESWSDTATDDDGRFWVSQLRAGKYIISLEGGGTVERTDGRSSSSDLPVKELLLLKTR